MDKLWNKRHSSMNYKVLSHSIIMVGKPKAVGLKFLLDGGSQDMMFKSKE